jgi:molecular chaperone HtpG
MTEQTHSFQAEVARLLHIVAHSLYSEKEIFLRELISNASDACDRLRYAALTQPELLAEDAALEVRISIDKAARTLSIADNGIGMNRQDLIDNLGTIARSGTSAFVQQLSGDASKDVKLIGQFGVGFYSAFMVADRLEVLSRKAGETEGWRWTSAGTGDFTVGEAAVDKRGTIVIVHLRKDEDEFLEPMRLQGIVKKYSDHIALPIRLVDGDKDETVNAASALWTRSKSEITPEQYKEFYHHVGHAFDEPWLTLHQKAEGKLEYTMLLFVPSEKPFDLFNPDRKHRVKLYVRRVFITDDCEGLVPAYLRFLRGVVDSEDLPLNISREMLQNNPVLTRIRQAVVKRVLGELETKAEKAPEEYAKFWVVFGAVLKEGLYEDFEQRDRLLKLARFHSTVGDDLVSLEQYVSRMKEGQSAIYTISGDNLETLRKSPQIEGFKSRGVEVLLLTDPVDDFWLRMAPTFQDKPFKSATRGGADLSQIKTGEAAAKPDAEAPSDSQIGTLVALLKQTLGSAVKNVRTSDRLTDSAVCLVADEGDMDMHLARLLKQHRQDVSEAARILEINPRHALIRRLSELAVAPGAADRLADAAYLLLDQARIVEGEPVPDPAAFARRLAAAMTQGLAA